MLCERLNLIHDPADSIIFRIGIADLKDNGDEVSFAVKPINGADHEVGQAERHNIRHIR